MQFDSSYLLTNIVFLSESCSIQNCQTNVNTLCFFLYGAGKSSNLFTGVLFNNYDPPKGFCFDVFCADDPINDDPKLFGYNLDAKVKEFIRVSRQWAAPYKTKNVLMTMGSDFQYMAAHTWYKNLDKLIKYGKMNILHANFAFESLSSVIVYKLQYHVMPPVCL